MQYSVNKLCPYCGRILSSTAYEGAASNQVFDYGPNPFVFNLSQATANNKTFRTALWTGGNLQLTVMSINPGEDIGPEIHNDFDQFLRVEQGTGLVRTGQTKDTMNYTAPIMAGSAIIIPAGTWHNIINTGNTPLKLQSIYAPPAHPWNTVHVTKADAAEE